VQNKSTRNSFSDDDCSTFVLLASGWELVSVATSSTSGIMVLSTNIASAFPEYLVSHFFLPMRVVTSYRLQWFDVKQGVNVDG